MCLVLLPLGKHWEERHCRKALGHQVLCFKPDVLLSKEAVRSPPLERWVSWSLSLSQMINDVAGSGFVLTCPHWLVWKIGNLCEYFHHWLVTYAVWNPMWSQIIWLDGYFIPEYLLSLSMCLAVDKWSHHLFSSRYTGRPWQAAPASLYSVHYHHAGDPVVWWGLSFFPFFSPVWQMQCSCVCLGSARFIFVLFLQVKAAPRSGQTTAHYIIICFVQPGLNYYTLRHCTDTKDGNRMATGFGNNWIQVFVNVGLSYLKNTYQLYTHSFLTIIRQRKPFSQTQFSLVAFSSDVVQAKSNGMAPKFIY